MNKQGWISFIAVFVFFEVMSFLVNGLLLESTYASLQLVWRPDMMSLLWIYHVISLVGAFFFVLIFSRGYEGKGIMEGIRFGFYMGVWMGVSYAYGTYAMIAIPYSLAISWFFTTLVQYILAGVIAAAIFGKKAIVARVAPM